MEYSIPEKQTAVQLIGPDELKLNNEKEVYQPGPYQILVYIKAVGLCFSDLKLLKQFSSHVRKGPILTGLDDSKLAEIPCYKPNEEPTVPGHEVFCEIIAIGDKVEHHKVGQKMLVQADYRWLKTSDSNAAFGYNLEGGLQQYGLLDERVIIDPVSGESCLIPVEKEDMSSSSIALVEPWACVESSFLTQERRSVKAGGRLLVVADTGREIKGINKSFSPDGQPKEIFCLCPGEKQCEALAGAKKADTFDALEDESFDDIIYFGSSKNTIDTLNDKLAIGGVINIVLGGNKIGADVSVGVGRVHYGMTRWTGTVTDDASDSYKHIPATGEIRKGDKSIIIGAAGPMGQMHTIRLICSGVEDISVLGTDFDNERLESLGEKTYSLAEERGVEFGLVNPKEEPIDDEKFSYFDIMAPVGPIVAQAVKDSMEGAVINIFAGIPASVKQDIDLDTYITNKCFMFGTSGSRVSDMMIVLEKVLSGQLNTDCSVDAVCGMAGAIDGIRAVEQRTLAGKIIVYPELKNLPLTTLVELCDKYPQVYEKLAEGIWTRQAEEQLLKDAN